MKVIPLEKKKKGIIPWRGTFECHNTKKATASLGNRKEGSLAPWSRWAAPPWPFHSSWRLLLIAESYFEASLLIRAFPNASHLRKEAKQGKMTSREKRHALGKPSALPDEHKRPDLETDVLILLLHSLHCFPFGMQYSLFNDLGHSWAKGQQHTSHVITRNDKSLITYAVRKGIFFWKCTHCLVIYLLRSLIKGQQS